MAERYPESEVVLDDELLYDDGPRRSTWLRRDERPEDIVREGEVLAGKYRVERIPGRSGLGVLVQVRHMELGQEVTLKFLVPEACAYPEFVQRFVREARAAVKIQGEHVARVTDVGRLESGAPYMVREYLRGPDLGEVLKVRGPLPIAEAVDYLIQACEGVAEGHALGVVHRNLRPSSLIVTRRSDGSPLVKVIEFAASEALHVNPFTERAVSLVGTSAIMASLPYLAPEQIRDPLDVDARADVYSLAAVLFELLTGTPVYAAEAAPALLAMVAADAAPPMRSLRQDVPGELDHVVLRCLAKNRAIRYPSVAELVLALSAFASPEASSSIEHVVRLGRRTSTLPGLGEARRPSPLPAPREPLPSVTAPLPPVAPLAAVASPARGRHGTLLMNTAEPLARQSLQPRISHDDVTTINPYSTYVPPAAPIEAPRIEPLRHTPQPPPLRSSAPPPLRSVSPPPAPVSERPAPAMESTALPPAPPRSSISGLSRSWAVPDEPAKPLFNQRRLIAVGAIAACATLGAVLAFRAGASRAAAAAAAMPAAAAPARIAAPPAPAPAPEPPPVTPEPSAAAATAAVAAAVPAAPAQPAVAAPAPPAVAPALVAARVAAAPAPAPAKPAALSAPRRPANKPREATADASESAPRKPIASAELFDDPR